MSGQMDPILNLLNQRPKESWQWSFRPEAPGHDPINALALCNAALLTYSDQAGVEQFLQRWQFSHIESLRGFHTQGFVARQGSTILVAFRGTEPTNGGDWLSDVNYHQQSLANVPGLVHGGFAHAFDEVFKQVRDAVEKLSQGMTPRLFITGHSLGGALAVLATAVLHFQFSRKIAALYTYGQPRVGDSHFSKAFDQELGAVTFRYVNDLDIVPHVPPVHLPGAMPHRIPGPVADFLSTLGHTPLQVKDAIASVVKGETFAHVGQLKLFLADGTVTDSEQAWQEREVIYSGDLVNLLRDAPSLLRARLRRTLSESRRVLDHDPLNGYLPKLEGQLRPK